MVFSVLGMSRILLSVDTQWPIMYNYVFTRTPRHGNVFLIFTIPPSYEGNIITSSNGNISRVTVLCADNSPVTGEFHSQRPVTRSLDVSLICARINGWENNCDAGDLRRNRAHYDVTVMNSSVSGGFPTQRTSNVELCWFRFLACTSCWAN